MISQRLFSPRILQRSLSNMTTSSASPFTQSVIRALRKIYPEELADKSFDNTGLLLEAPHKPGQKRSVLLTIDLTRAVADEAIARKDSLIVAYHPIIFRPLKSLTLDNSQQSTLLRLAQEGISVYSPHTALDALAGGLTDWLANDVVAPKAEGFDELNCTTSVIKGLEPRPLIQGYGRIVRFHQPQQLGDLVSRITKNLGELSGVTVAVPQTIPRGERHKKMISSVGIVAGSGGSLLNGLDIDVLFTGELSHHEALAAIEKGQCVITALHSNTERHFLHMHMARQVECAVLEEIVEANPDERPKAFDVSVSEVDADPYEFIPAGKGKW